MKYKNGNFIELSREIFSDEYKSMSDAAKWLYCYLSELEHKHTGNQKKWFYHTDAQLSEALNWSISKVQRAKRELYKYGFINIAKTKTEATTKHMTAYIILK